MTIRIRIYILLIFMTLLFPALPVNAAELSSSTIIKDETSDCQDNKIAKEESGLSEDGIKELKAFGITYITLDLLAIAGYLIYMFLCSLIYRFFPSIIRTQEESTLINNEIQQKPALCDRLEQDKELWLALSDILDMTQKQLTHIACIKDQFHQLIIENEMEEIFSGAEDAICRKEQNICRELNLCDYWMHIYEPDKKADFSAMKSMLKKVFTKNEKSINDTKVFILYLTEYIMQQYNSSNGEVSIGIYEQAIESLAGGSG